MKVKNIVILLLILSLGGLIAYRITKNNSESDKSKDKGGKKPPMGITAIVAKAEDFANDLTLSGSIEAN
mgnify:CR=1 FL=1